MISCDDCGVGRYQQVHAPYVWRNGGKTSIVPDVPAVQCDVCGLMYYDEAAIYNLHLLIDHGSKGVKNKSSRLKSADPPLWSATRRR
jgi:hypothetical protein